MAFKKLFEPIKIGSVQIKNRYAYSPTNLVFNSWDGMVNDQEIAYYTARAMGGTGLIIYGAILSSEFGVPYMQHPWVFCFDIAHVPGLSMLAEHIRLAGGVPFIQLLPVPSCNGQNWKGVQPVAPSALKGSTAYHDVFFGLYRRLSEERIPGSWTASNIGISSQPSDSRQITLDEIQLVIKQHAKACRLATYAGFDGIEVHACHSYLVDSFRDPRMNKRKDRYGGSEENRNRFPVEIIEASIRAAKEENRNMVVGVRLSCECGEGGYAFEETKRLALQLQELGIEYLNITFGKGQQISDPKADGPLLNHAKELKRILKIPVITPTVHDPELAEQAVAEGWTDIVSAAMPHMADPEFVGKVKDNRIKDINKCIMCDFCQVPFNLALPGRCAVNPEMGFERFNPKYQIRQGFKKAGMLPHVLRKK